MFDIISETFLQQYFLYSAILGEYCDGKRLFDYVADLFFVPNSQRDYLFALTNDEPVRDIVTYGDAMRYSRIRQYCELNEYTLVHDDAQEMVSIKSNAIKTAMSNNLYACANATRAQIYKSLIDSALAGNIVAMRLLGTLHLEGIFVEKQWEIGLKNLNKAGQWGDLVSLLTLGRYLTDKHALSECLSRLAAVVENTQYSHLLDKLQECVGVTAIKPSEEIQLLKKAFAAMRVKADVYNPLCARLLFGNAIDIKDKEQILFSDNKGILSEVCDLPLKLTYGNLTVNATTLSEKMPLRREKEQSKLKTELLNADLRQYDNYCPLCLVSDSDYALETYVNAIIATFEQTAHVECIDVADLKPYDFDPTPGNVFVRSCDDEQNNVFLLVLKGDVDNTTLQHVTQFLDSAKRRRFRLNSPRVTLDLSPILPICVCDNANASRLGDAVECLHIADISAQEKISIVHQMLESKSKLYLTKTVSADSDVISMLCNCSPATAERVLDKLFSEHRFDSEFTAITSAMLKPYEKALKNRAQKAYGFGGYMI